MPDTIPATANHLTAPSFATRITANIINDEINQYRTSSIPQKNLWCGTMHLNTVITWYIAPNIAPQHRLHSRKRNSSAINSLKQRPLFPLFPLFLYLKSLFKKDSPLLAALATSE